MSLNIRKTTGNDAGIVTQPAENNQNSIASEVNQTIDITYATVLPNVKPNKRNIQYAAPPNVIYNQISIDKNILLTFLGRNSTSSNKKLPPLLAYNPPIQSTLQKLSSDVVNNAVSTATNGNTQLVSSAGISSLDLRPEIISILDLSPMWRQEPKNANINSVIERQYTDTGMFLKFSHQTKLLRQETLINILKDIKRITKQDKVFKDIRNDFLNEIRLVDNNMMFFKNVLENINTIKKSFEIKLIPEENYKLPTKNIATTPLKKFYLENMGYSNNQYEVFSDTKLLLQMLFDLNIRLKTYSFKFLDQLNLTRKSDFKPINIDLSENITGYKFDISNFISTTNEPINASVGKIFDSLVTLLPKDPDSRIKLLTYILAKEYIISSNLGNVNNSSMLKTFNAPNVGNPFSNIIGDISPNILQLPKNRNGLSFLPYSTINNQASNTVLAFESKYIEDPANTNISWIPGQNYYTEQIINPQGNSWDISAYNAYVTNYNNTVQNANKTIRTLMGIGLQESATSLITPMMLNKKILQAFYIAFDKVTPVEEDVAAKFDPTTYAEKLALQQQRDEIQAQVDELKQNGLLGTATVDTSAGSEFDPIDKATDMFGEYKPDQASLDREIEKLRNDPRIPLLEAKLAELNRKINAINVPDPALLQTTVEQALIVNLFNTAAEYADLKKLLFQFCIMAGLVRNISNEKTGLFNVLALNEINTVQKLEIFAGYGALATLFSGKEVPELKTNDGSKLLQNLKLLADSLAASYIKIFRQSTGNTSQTVVGFNSGKTIDLTISQADVANVLERAALGQGTIGNVNLIYQYINLANNLFASAQMNSSNIHLLSDNSGRTRLNSLSCSTQLFMLFEIFCQYAKKYSFIAPSKTLTQDVFGNVQVEEGTITKRTIGTVSFDRTGDAPVNDRSKQVDVTFTTETLTETKTGVLSFLTFKVDLTNTSLVQKSIDILTRDYKEEEAETERKQNEFFLSLEDIRKKIEKEYADIDTILSIFEVIGNNLNTALNQAKQFFTQTGLKQFLASSPVANLNLIKNVSQIRIAAQVLNDIKEKTRVPADYVTAGKSEDSKEIELIVSDQPTVEDFNLLEKMMKQYTPGTTFGEDQFRRNFKVLSVGLPTGFCKVLSDRINRSNINAITFQDRQSDLIYINAYVRNAKYPDLVFKPTKYIFDASLFITKKNILDSQPQSGESYAAVINRMAMTDFEDPFNPVEVDLATLKADPKYGFLTQDQFTVLLYNHITSYLFGMYMFLHTGVKPSEDTFTYPEPAERILNSKMKGIIAAYLKALNLPAPGDNKATSEILGDSNVSDTIKDMYRIHTYGSLVLNTNEVVNRVLIPKLYDRIFYIPVQTYLLEIDVAKTKIYNPNINFDLYRDNLVINNKGQYYLKDGAPDQFIVKDIFVQIETVSDTRAFHQEISPILPNINKIINSSQNVRIKKVMPTGLTLGNVNKLSFKK